MDEPRLHEDWHVPSTDSDGDVSLDANLRAAIDAGLTRIHCVARVDAATPWVVRFVLNVSRVAREAPLIVAAGLEAGIVNEDGALDVPADHDAADYLYAAAHRFPLGCEAVEPEEIRARITRGEILGRDVVDALVRATGRVMEQRPKVVLARLFGILPRAGLSEWDVSDEAVDVLARLAAETGAVLEVDERCRCPGERVVRAFLARGAQVVCGSGASHPANVGRYAYAASVLGRASRPPGPSNDASVRDRGGRPC